MATEINMEQLSQMLADYSEIDALKERLFDKESSPFYDNAMGDYEDFRHEQIDATCMEISLKDIRKVVDKIGVFELMDMVKDEYGDDLLGIMDKTIGMRYRSLMYFVLKEYIEEQEIATTMADMIQDGEWSEEEQVDTDEASDAETDEDY
jgi:hypothetical protein